MNKSILRFVFFLCLCCWWCIHVNSAQAATVLFTGPNGATSTTETNPLPSNPNIPGDVSQSNLNNIYTQAFGNSDNTLPNLAWLESPTLVVLLLEGGGSVDKAQNFDFKVTGDYWTVKTNIEFNPATAVVVDPNDHITLSGYLQHTGKLSQDDIPHEGDAAAGPQIPYTIDVNAGDKKPRDIFGSAAGASQAAADNHPNNSDHFDLEQSAIFARVSSKSVLGVDVIDDITGWAGVVGAQHLIVPLAPVPEPSTIFLFGGGILASFLRRRSLNKDSRRNKISQRKFS